MGCGEHVSVAEVIGTSHALQVSHTTIAGLGRAVATQREMLPEVIIASNGGELHFPGMMRFS